ncbi:MAG: C-terminal binding protein, partial [Ferruginibacter sp.]
MSYNIIITDSGFPDNAPEKEVLDSIQGCVTNIQCRDEAGLKSQVGEADALIVQWAPITKNVIENLSRCKVIVRYGIGMDNIDLAAAREKGIPVCNVPDYCINEVADHTIALALGALRQIKETDLRIREGVWKIILPRPVASFSSLDFCIAGFGRIARQVARGVVGLGFKVSAYDPFVDQAVFDAAGVQRLTIDQLLKQADILSLHLPLTADTHHFINKATLEKMKPGSLIVNTSRGGLINASDLAAALASQELWCAALDVFEE